MAKWSGTIGYVVEEISKGITTESVVPRKYIGDLTRVSRRINPGSNTVNDDIIISNEISVIGDPYAHENFMWIRYATYMNTKWKVTNVEVQYPRLILTLGGVYNG